MKPVSIVENRDCMEAMAEFPDKFFDLVIADPPHGIGFENYERVGLGQKTRKRFTKSGKRQWDAKPPKGCFFNELFRVSKNQLIWGGNYFDLPPTVGFIVWDKEQPLENFSSAEFAWSSFRQPSKIYRERNFANGHKFHPTQKPVALYKWLLKNYAKPGDKILDPMLGSGSSRIAAYDMGFDFWGYELDSDYFEAAQKRFNAHISKPTLFAPGEMYDFEQTKLFE